jgi:hypothetical protein
MTWYRHTSPLPYEQAAEAVSIDGVLDELNVPGEGNPGMHGM